MEFFYIQRRLAPRNKFTNVFDNTNGRRNVQSNKGKECVKGAPPPKKVLMISHCPPYASLYPSIHYLLFIYIAMNIKFPLYVYFCRDI